MSTTFDVYPSTDKIPSFAQLLQRADEHLNAFLRHYQISTSIQLSVCVMDDNNQPVPMSLTDPAWWSDDHYAWFSIPGVAGGTDAYSLALDDLNKDILKNDLAARRDGSFADAAAAALKIGKWWYFRRSAGQPAIINIAYGLLAASLAEFTGGIIDSGDNAWDFNLLPARPAEFLTWYFRPEMTANLEKKDWAQQCIGALSAELPPQPQVPNRPDAPRWW